MTPTAALEQLILDQTVEGRVVVASYGLQVTGRTRTTYADAGEATAAAHGLLAQVLGLGYVLQGALVGAEPADGGWRGALVEVYLAATALAVATAA